MLWSASGARAVAVGGSPGAAAAFPESLPLDASMQWFAFGSAILQLVVFGLYTQWAEG